MIERCEGCGESATLQCPTCKKLGLPASHFCNQVILILKQIHQIVKSPLHPWHNVWHGCPLLAPLLPIWHPQKLCKYLLLSQNPG
jgi:hypothetical protein